MDHILISLKSETKSHDKQECVQVVLFPDNIKPNTHQTNKKTLQHSVNVEIYLLVEFGKEQPLEGFRYLSLTRCSEKLKSDNKHTGFVPKVTASQYCSWELSQNGLTKVWVIHGVPGFLQVESGPETSMFAWGHVHSAGMSMFVPLLSSLVVNWLERSYVEADRKLLFLAVPQHYISLKKCFFFFLNEQ